MCYLKWYVLTKLNLYKFWLVTSCQKRWIRRVHYGGGSDEATCCKSGIYLKKVSISICAHSQNTTTK